MSTYDQKQDKHLIRDEDPKEKIDQDRLNEFDIEASNYISSNSPRGNHKNYMYTYPNEYSPFEGPNLNTHASELNLKLLDENQNNKQIIEQYKTYAKNLEMKIAEYQHKVQEFEDDIKVAKENAEKYKEESESLQFQLKLANEKQKIQEANFAQIKEIQGEYENTSVTLCNEFKIKEENLKKKFKKLEDAMLNQLKSQENDYEDSIAKLNFQIKELKKIADKQDKEINAYQEKIINIERFFQMKEQEFEDIVHNKDKKLKELEMCIKSISEEAGIQIDKLSENVEELVEKLNNCKQREMEMTEDYLRLKGQLDKEKQENKMEEQGNVSSVAYQKRLQNANSLTRNVSGSSQKIIMKNETPVMNHFTNASESDITNNPNQSRYEKQKMEELRNRITQLESETSNLTRELQLKYEECETLNDEVIKLSSERAGIEKNCHLVLQAKDEEIFNLMSKINELDVMITNYGSNLSNIKASYEQSLQDHKKELSQKNTEMRNMKEMYERKIGDLHMKIEEIVLKDKFREVNNSKSGIQPAYLESSCNYTGKGNSNLVSQIANDEEVKKSIDQQINFIKEKLEKYNLK